MTMSNGFGDVFLERLRGYDSEHADKFNPTGPMYGGAAVAAAIAQLITWRDYARVIGQQNLERVDDPTRAGPVGIDGVLMISAGLSPYLQIITKGQWTNFFLTTLYNFFAGLVGFAFGKGMLNQWTVEFIHHTRDGSVDLTQTIDFKDRGKRLQSIWISLAFTQAIASTVGMSLGFGGTSFMLGMYLVWVILMMSAKAGSIPYSALTHCTMPSCMIALASSDWLCAASYAGLIFHEYYYEAGENTSSGRNSMLSSSSDGSATEPLKLDSMNNNSMYTHKRRMGKFSKEVFDGYRDQYRIKYVLEQEWPEKVFTKWTGSCNMDFE